MIDERPREVEVPAPVQLVVPLVLVLVLVLVLILVLVLVASVFGDREGRPVDPARFEVVGAVIAVERGVPGVIRANVRL